MFRSVLVANRGEIAVRIMRTARAMGMRTAAVYSEADRAAPHVRLADEAHYIGGAPARESYLDVSRIIEAARKAKAECVHPGYGFLAERAELAEGCAAAGIAFVGPSPAAMRLLGSKSEAKALMQKARVPVVPGYFGDRQDTRFLREKAYETGYPVLIKATAGGGGKGMRRVARALEFDAALAAAVREAEASFGDGRVLIEKVIENPRHIEIQLFADRHGDVVHLFERDCSAQRRHQKVMEEAPAPGLGEELRAALAKAAVAAAKAARYEGAGTVEFLVDAVQEPDRSGYYFLEMNTRLQVEHPVTEMVTGTDLVEWQFRVAAGEKLPLAQDAIRCSGHAVEARLYAEDPANGFLPSTGKIHALRFPSGEGIRIESGVEENGEVSAHYDPMIAKLIVHAPTRDGALDKLARALDATMLIGPRSNIAFLQALAGLPAMRAGRVDTGTIEREAAALGVSPVGVAPLETGSQPADCAAAARAVETLVLREQQRLAAAARRRSNERRSPWDRHDAFGLGATRATPYAVTVDGKHVVAQLHFAADGVQATVAGERAADCSVVMAGESAIAWRHGRQTVVTPLDTSIADAGHDGENGLVTAPMHGKVLAVSVEQGMRVSRGQPIVVIEAMKMEHALTAPIAGKVVEIAVAVGDQVAERAKIAVIAAASPETTAS